MSQHHGVPNRPHQRVGANHGGAHVAATMLNSALCRDRHVEVSLALSRSSRHFPYRIMLEGSVGRRTGLGLDLNRALLARNV